ncbi:MAG: hypothetical protein ACREWG_01600, partial [Gammaproteobacteria bacterium]
MSKTATEQAERGGGVPGPRTTKMRPGAFDRRATLDPKYERIMATPGNVLDDIYNGIGAFCQFGESGPCPPRQVVGRRIEQEIRDAGQRGRDVRNANEDKAARFRRLHHLGEQGRGRPDM